MAYDANANVHAKNEIPWYDTLNGKMSVSGFRMTYVGRLVTHSMVWTLELLRIAPKVKHLPITNARNCEIYMLCYHVHIGIYPGICAIECYRYVSPLMPCSLSIILAQYYKFYFFFVQLL